MYNIFNKKYEKNIVNTMYKIYEYLDIIIQISSSY